MIGYLGGLQLNCVNKATQLMSTLILLPAAGRSCIDYCAVVPGLAWQGRGHWEHILGGSTGQAEAVAPPVVLARREEGDENLSMATTDLPWPKGANSS